MNSWTSVAVRGADLADKKHEERAEIYNKINFEMETIKRNKYFNQGYVLRLRDWAELRPLWIEFFRRTNKTFPLYSSTNAALFEQMHNLMESTGLNWETLNNARIYAMETLEMEAKCINFQRNTVQNLQKSLETFLRNTGLVEQ